MTLPAKIRLLGVQDYTQTWQAMQAFTLQRTPDTTDEFWVLEHEPVYTLGLNGKAHHRLQDNGIACVNTDRGGQITYHGRGQLIVYALLDLRRHKLGARNLVSLLENAMIATLQQYGLDAHARADAPGVYLGERKIGALGLRIRNGCSYHGLSLNNSVELDPFKAINPCGHPGLAVTRMADFGIDVKTEELAIPVLHYLSQNLPG